VRLDGLHAGLVLPAAARRHGDGLVVRGLRELDQSLCGAAQPRGAVLDLYADDGDLGADRAASGRAGRPAVAIPVFDCGRGNAAVPRFQIRRRTLAGVAADLTRTRTADGRALRQTP